jgi:hypothetical protein
MGNVTGTITGNLGGSITGSLTGSITVTSTGGEITLTSDAITKTKVNPVKYNHALSQIARASFVVPSPGGTYQFKIKAPTLNGSMLHKGSLAIINYLSSLGNSTYSLAIASSVNEGATLTGTLTTTNVDPGTGFAWRIVHTGISNNSHYEEIAGGFTVGNAGTGTFDIKPLEDKTTNPSGQNKTFTVEITKAGTVVATSSTITVNDTSLGPTYSLAFSSGSVNEGASVTGTVTATANPPVNGTILNWTLKPSSGFDSTKYFETLSGTVTINSGSGTFTVTALEDRETNTGKSFQVEVRDGTGTVVVAAGTSVTVNDTSQTPGAGGALTLTTSLGGNYFSSLNTYALSESNQFLYFYPDGTWMARDSMGVSSTGNWFTPTTPNIGAKYWINIAGVENFSIGGGVKSDNITWQQLGTMQNCYVISYAYRCVDPKTPILVQPDGTSVLAEELQVGTNIYTMHEFTKDWNYYPVKAVARNQREKALVTFTDNSTLLCSTTHKFYIRRNEWLQLFELKAGDYVASYNEGMKQIASIEPQGMGEVITLEIEDAHTYVANKLISHNIKARDSSTFFSNYIGEFTIQIADNASGTGAQQAVVTLEAAAGNDLR